MKALRGVLAGLALVGATALASAPASAQTNWSGLYFGGHVGWTAADYDWTWQLVAADLNAGASQSPSGLGAGAHLGLQHQWGNWVAGIEVGWTGTDLQERTVGGFQAAFPKNYDSKVSYLATITPKLGWSMGSWMGYVKGGYAVGGVRLNNSDAATGAAQTTSLGRESGWTVGGGLEWKVASNVSLGLEYDFARLNSSTRSDVHLAGTVQSNHLLGDVELHQVMARLNIYLHRPEAVAEPMK